MIFKFKKSNLVSIFDSFNVYFLKPKIKEGVYDKQ